MKLKSPRPFLRARSKSWHRSTLIACASLAVIATVGADLSPIHAGPAPTPNSDQERSVRRTESHGVRAKISLGERGIEVVAGSSDFGDGGPATAATLAGIGGIAVDPRGALYVSDIGHNRVRRVDPESGRIETVVGNGRVDGPPVGAAREISLLTPGALALDARGETLFIAEVVGHRVIAVDLVAGTARDLGAPSLGFGQPVGLTWTPEALLVVDTLEAQVWRLEHGSSHWIGAISERQALAGGARSVVVFPDGDLVISAFFGHRIVRFDSQTDTIQSLAGTGRPGLAPDGTKASRAPLATPDGMVLNPSGDLFVSDLNNERIARIDAADGRLTTYARAAKGTLRWTPGPLAIGGDGSLWVGDVYGSRVFRIPTGSGEGDRTAAEEADGKARESVVRGADPVLVAGGGPIGDGGQASAARLSHPGRIAIDPEGNLFVSDAMSHRIRRIDAKTGVINTVVGTGFPGFNGDHRPGHQAQVHSPGGLLIHRGGLYIGDYYNNRVRRLDLEQGTIETVAGTGRAAETGNGGLATAADMLNPHAMSLDDEGRLLITSAVTSSVRRLDLDSGQIETVALDSRLIPQYRSLVFYGISTRGSSVFLADGMRNQIVELAGDDTLLHLSRAGLDYPMDVAVSPTGTLYIADTRNNRVVRALGEQIEVVAEGLGRPRGLAFDQAGDLYVADTFHGRVLRLDLPDSVTGESSKTAAGGKP